MLFAKASEADDILVVGLTEIARRARTYEAYLQDLAVTHEAERDLVAIGLAGPRNRVTKLTKRLLLLGDDQPTT